MRNLKKLLAVITVVAMMATLFVIPASAAGLSDIAGTKYESAAARLNALGIITGREDGKFYPDDTITRAEFAAVVVRTLGYGTAADAAKGQTKFSDVASDFWASGYINLANSLGIIKGRPDGTFGPNDKVLYEEAVTMVVRALGYEPAAQANGGYPTGYLTIASQEDVDDDAVSAIGAPASRGIVAKLVDNSLEVAMMIQSGYGTEQTFVKSGTQGTTKQTLLDSKLKLDVREAVVQSVDLDKGEIKVKMTNNADNGDDIGDIKTYDVFAGIPFVGLENAQVTLWVKDGVAYNIETDTTVLYDFLTKVNGEDDKNDIAINMDEIEDITFLYAGTYDVKENSTGTAADFDLYENNGAKVNLSATDADEILDGEWFVKAFINDGLVTRVDAYKIADADVGLITAVADNSITMTRGKDEGKKITNLDDADSVNVFIDGTPKTLADLEEGMVLQYKIIGKDYYFLASTKIVEGKLDAAKDSKVEIDGTYVDLFGQKFYSTDNGDSYEAIADASSMKDLLGSEVIGYKNYRGKIVYLKGEVETTSDFYGIVTGVNTFNDQIKVARNVDGELKTVTYDTDLPSTATAPYKTFSDIDDNYTTDNPGTTAAARAARLYKFSLDADGVITKAKLIAVDTLTDVQFNKDSDYIKNEADTTRIYTDSATIFQLDGSDIKLLKWADIEGTSLPASTLATPAGPGSGLDIWYNDDDVTPDVILLNDTNGTKISFSTSDTFLGFVTSKELAADDDYTFVMNTNSGEQTFTVDDGDVNGAKEKVLAIYRLTGDEGVAKISVASKTYSDDNELDFSAFDAITNYDSVSNAVVADNGIDGKTIKVNGDSTVYALASDAVVYEVDTEDNNYTISDITEISEETGNTSKVSFVTYKGKIKFLFFWN